MNKIKSQLTIIALVFSVVLSTGCETTNLLILPTSNNVASGEKTPMYLIGPGDNINVFVWGNAELSSSVPVRPDGRITTPLVEDIVASGKTPAELARMMEKQLSLYIKNPVVTVYVTGFVGRYSEQIRVVGEATRPTALPYNENMTLLDVMIAVGGLTEFAAGNKATVVRVAEGKRLQYRVFIDALLKDGDISANVDMLPGDVLIIPEAWF